MPVKLTHKYQYLSLLMQLNRPYKTWCSISLLIVGSN